MDPSTAAAAPTGLTAWIMANGQIVAFIAQLLFWLVLGVASIWAAAVFNRYVNFMMRGAETAETAEAPETSEPEDAVSVEEFVE
jgi:hypothetical protein